MNWCYICEFQKIWQLACFKGVIKETFSFSQMNVFFLPMLTGKNYVLLNSVQEFIEIETWLLLTFFNQLSSTHFIVKSTDI